jgi:hypothetical protein
MAFATPDDLYNAIVAEITRQMDGVRAAVLAVILPNVLSTNAQTGADAVKIDESFKRLGALLANEAEDEARDEQLAKTLAEIQTQIKTLSASGGGGTAVLG